MRSRIIVLLGLIAAGCPPAKDPTDTPPTPADADADADADTDADADADADTDTGGCAGIFDVSLFDASCFQ
jgi:hypothetical protein